MLRSLQQNKRNTLALLVGTLLAFSPLTALAQDAAQKGLEIATRSDNSDNGFGDSTANAIMVLTNTAGQSSSRELRFMTLERASANVGDKTISLFLTPADVKGTAVLSHAKITANDDQWIYLPALKRVKRISSSNKSGPFMGSEFAYEDITAQELGKFTYTWIRSEKCGSATCDVIERIPTYKKSGYSRQLVWINSKTLQAETVQFFDRAGNHVKTMTSSGWKKYSGYWRQASLTMVNHRNGKSTVLKFSNWKFKTGLTDRDFKSTALQNLR